MRESGYYPPGAEFDPNAPWNEPVIPDRTFRVYISQSLGKECDVTTNDYVPGGVEVEYEKNDDGKYESVVSQEPDDTSNTRWYDVYKNEHQTPLELIATLKEMCQEKLTELGRVILTSDPKSASELTREKQYLEYLISECEGWCEEDLALEQE